MPLVRMLKGYIVFRKDGSESIERECERCEVVVDEVFAGRTNIEGLKVLVLESVGVRLFKRRRRGERTVAEDIFPDFVRHLVRRDV